MRVSLDQIKEYDRNPRRERNEAHEQIKSSIHRRGFIGALPITRRPGEPHYRVAEGGNTVLRILKDLHQESQDPRFHTLQCLFEPWISESETLIAHLIENDARGDLLFIDRARAVTELRGLLEEETGQRFSTRELTAALRARGYTIDPATISRMDFAVEVLFPVIPIALRSGLGPSQIDRIRKLHKVILAFLGHRECETSLVEEAERWFLDCLARHDSEDWLLGLVESEIESYLAETLAESIAKVRADLQLIAEHGEPGLDAPPTPPLRPPPVRAEGHAARATAGPDPDGDPSLEASVGPLHETECSETSFEQQWPGPEPPAREEPALTRSRPPPGDLKPQDRHDWPRDLKSLRGRMWTLASQLASRNDLGECILTCPKGCGYLVDLPAEPLCVSGRPETVKGVERLTLWWLLSTFADQWPFGPGIQGVPALVYLEDSRMYPVLQAAAAEDGTTLSSILVPFVDEPPMFAGLCQYLFAVLNDKNFETLMQLIETRWALQAHCRRLGRKWVWDL